MDLSTAIGVAVLCFVFICLFFLVLFGCLLIQKGREVAALEGQLDTAIRNSDTAAWQRDTAIRERNHAIRVGNRAEWQLDRVVRHCRLLEWIHNVEPFPVEDGTGEDEGFISVEE